MEKTRNIRITISYEGTRYNGWQRQGMTKNTIQEKLEQMFGKLLGEEIEMAGSGRTDAGVHALAQVANFHTESSMPAEKMLAQANQYLPADIAILSLKDVSARFHSRLNAKGKHYRYRIHNSSIPEVFDRNYVYSFPDSLDLNRMSEAAKLLTGQHDFASFCANARMKKSTERFLSDICIERINNEIVLDYYGNGFLHHMVRILTGTLIEVGTGKRQPAEMDAILAGTDRKLAGFTAPAQGLTLVEVSY